MAYVIIFSVAVPVFALAFTGVTVFLGLFWSRFKPVGEGSIWDFYRQFLIVASVYVVLSLLGIGGLIGLLIMALAYKTVFGAGWVEALVIGIFGGALGWVMMRGVLRAAVEVGLLSG
jgi:hypothetical protein